MQSGELSRLSAAGQRANKDMERLSQCVQLPCGDGRLLSLALCGLWHSPFGMLQLVSFSNTRYKHSQTARVAQRLTVMRMCEFPCHVATNSRQWCESYDCLFCDNCTQACFGPFFISVLLFHYFLPDLTPFTVTDQ